MANPPVAGDLPKLRSPKATDGRDKAKIMDLPIDTVVNLRKFEDMKDDEAMARPHHHDSLWIKGGFISME